MPLWFIQEISRVLGALPGTVVFPGGSVVNYLPANAEDTGSVCGSGRSPGEGNGCPLQYSCLGNPVDRGAWQAVVHDVAKELDTIQSKQIQTKQQQQQWTKTKCMFLINHNITYSMYLVKSFNFYLVRTQEFKCQLSHQLGM